MGRTGWAVTVVCLSATILASTARADWRKLLDQVGSDADGATSNLATTALSNDEVIAGLKEALAEGAESAISKLGRKDGFLRNSLVKIPLPEQVQSLEKVLRTLGQGHYADEFIVTMNRAAESAVPEAGAIVGDAIRQLSVEDAKSILDGPDDAATQYFRRVGEKRLTERILPIVSDATSRAGVTAAYKQVVDQAGFAAKMLDTKSLDLDRYVTGKSLDGLFAMIAVEEKRIRENPAARTTDLLQKVFGAAR